MLCRMVMLQRRRNTGTVPVFLNVYDLTPMNGYAYWFGLGVYHSGVEVHGVEYGFGAHDHSNTGIFQVEPKHCPGFTFRKSIFIGRTDLGPQDVRALMASLAHEYSGNSYHLITKNCNHFCDDVCFKLTGKSIPRWVNRLARIGFLCKCVLPAELNQVKVRQVGLEDSRLQVDNKKLRRHSSRSSTSSNGITSPSLTSRPSVSTTNSSNTRQKYYLPPSTVLDNSTSTLTLRL